MLLVTITTVVAVIGVASIGLLMIGRINWRYGSTVILGCFILFGAPGIASRIEDLARGRSEVVPLLSPIAP